MPIMINDHDKLHESVARATLAGGGAAVAGLFLPAHLAAAVMALAVSVAIVPPSTWRSAACALLWACAAGGAAKLGGTVGAIGGALAIGASLARDVDSGPRLLAVTLGTVGALGAAMIGRAIVQTEVLAFLPSGLETLAGGASAGLVVGVSSIGRHVSAVSAPVERELDRLRAEGELGELLGRAAVAYREAVAAMGREAPAARLAADDLVRRMARFGRHWQEVEAEAARSLPSELNERRLLVGRRLEATSDPLARAEFERARDALDAQLASLAEIARGRERAVARLTHQVATLERLRLAALRHRSVDAGRLGAELAPVVEELTEAGSDLDLESEALTEAQVVALPAARG
jgi:hypothetical protein